MQGALRRPARSSARSFFALPSVLALLALALFPVIARAESSESVYTPEVPTITTSKKPTKTHTTETPKKKHASSNNPAAEGSAAGGTSGGSSVKSKTESESEGQKSSVGGASGGGSNNPPKGGGGEGAGGGSKGGASKPESGISASKKVANAQPGTNVSESSGGSSPVVPILIAVAVLAAISIGVVLYRQRKSGQGPDRRVSSPNAN
jgi:cobalamin biosynthesis Mg chelatase CobN